MLFVAIGAVLYWAFARLLFGVNLLQGIMAMPFLSGPPRIWTFVACLSVLVGSWSVGGGSWHVLNLVWKWVRLYNAGDK
jgi:hypothetical protein